jgi:adenylosuccinate synthase
MTVIVLLSGPIAAGKSSLGSRLVEHLGATRVKTRELLAQRFPHLNDRKALQRAGDRLDRETNGEWIATSVAAMLAGRPRAQSPPLLVIDSVRIHEQVQAFRAAFGDAVLHVHLTADIDRLAERYGQRRSAFQELPEYGDVRRNQTERRIERLAPLADIVIETDRCTHDDVYARVASRIRYRHREDQRLVDVLVGGQYGSEGKGNIAHYLAREYDLLVRVGGPNAGHKVFRRDESPYTFHQLPSGALGNSDAVLVLGAGAVISLQRLQKEIADLAVDFSRLIIDPQAMIIDPTDVAFEQRGLKDEIASTAQGVGAATARKVLRGKEFNVVLARDVPALRAYIRDTVDFFASALQQGKRIMLEGTQGTMLSIHHGFYPHVTSRITSAPGCLAEAGLPVSAVRRIIMVCRTYPIRVGDTDTGHTSGHMSQEIDLATIAARSGLPLERLERVERTSTTNRKRRIAEFDWLMFRRALCLNGPTDIALTFVDYLSARNQEAFRYEQLTSDSQRVIEEIEQVAKVPVSLISTRFGERNIIDRRTW